MYRELLNGLSERVGSACPVNGNDYLGDDGLIYCGVCHTQKQVRVKSPLVPSGIVNCACKCYQEQAEKNKQEREFLKRAELARLLKRQGIQDSAYSKFTFEADNGSAPSAISAARWYADNFSRMRNENKGLMFMGGVGTGKTFAACCIANSVADSGYSIQVSTAVDLVRTVGDFSKADDVFSHIQSVDLFVIDDFGTSSTTGHALSLLFQIIDCRYRANLPLIITTNLTVNDFNNPKSRELERIYDRVKVMCSCPVSPVILDGKSLRSAMARANHYN